MKPEHTKQQRADLFAIARLLDKVPRKKFNMAYWVIAPNGAFASDLYSPSECGFAGCAIGWAKTLPRFKHKDPWQILQRLGLTRGDDRHEFSIAGQALFGGHTSNRNKTPKQVAKAIRTYLQDGGLPEISWR